MLRKALSSQQLAARIEAYDEAQSILAQELPILPLASSLRLQAYRYDIKGLVLSPFGNAFAGVYREKQDEVKSHDYLHLTPHFVIDCHLVPADLRWLQLELFHPTCAVTRRVTVECRVFWFNGLIHWDFGVSSINGQPIAEQLKRSSRRRWNCASSPSVLR